MRMLLEQRKTLRSKGFPFYLHHQYLLSTNSARCLNSCLFSRTVLLQSWWMLLNQDLAHPFFLPWNKPAVKTISISPTIILFQKCSLACSVTHHIAFGIREGTAKFGPKRKFQTLCLRGFSSHGEVRLRVHECCYCCSQDMICTGRITVKSGVIQFGGGEGRRRVDII